MVTNIENLKNVQMSREVELPPFMDGTPFTARIKSTSLINMVNKGRIPNPLIKVVLGMIDGENEEKDKKKDINETIEDKVNSFNLMFAIAKEALVEPTFEDIEKCGIELTDDQILAIFEHSMSSLNSASKFC